MASLKFLSYFICLLLCNVVMNDVENPSSTHRDMHFIAIDVGQNLSLQCQHERSVSRYYWYIQRMGEKLKAVSISYPADKTGTFYDDFKNNLHFKLETEQSRNSLKILDVQVSDTATYFCVSSISSMFVFREGTTVLVKDSGLKAHGSVHQSGSGNIHNGSVTLNCTVHNRTCDGEDMVYWFKESKYKQPEIITTQRGSNHQCKTNSNTQTQTCVYNLLMENPNISYGGTYYCAVASCGHVLFGNGTKVHVKGDEYDRLFVFATSLSLTLFFILNALLVFLLFKLHKRCIRQTSEFQISAKPAENAEDNQAGDQHYADVRVTRTRRQRKKPETECVYSVVKH